MIHKTWAIEQDTLKSWISLMNGINRGDHQGGHPFAAAEQTKMLHLALGISEANGADIQAMYDDESDSEKLNLTIVNGCGNFSIVK